MDHKDKSSQASKGAPQEQAGRAEPDAGPSAKQPEGFPETLSGALRGFSQRIREAVIERFITNIRDFLGDRQPLVWFLALLIGLAVGAAAIAFRHLIGLIQLPWLYTSSERVAAAAAAVPWWNVVLAPAIGGLIVGYLLERFVPGRRAHAVADVIEARALHNARIDPKVGLWSAFLSALSIGAGASVGREGPVVHLGATIAAYAEDRFKLSSAARRSLLACGVAAAISASFNAPIAGVVFAHEVILSHYALRALVPIVIASVAGGVLSRLYYGNFPAFIIPDYQITSYWEFPAFALLGVTCAVVAILFQFSLMATERVSWRMEMPLRYRCALGGLIVGLMGLVFPEVLGVGYGAMDAALQRELPLWLLLSLIVAKTAATSISLASRFAGGVFSPSLYLGAMAGAAFGVIATSTFPEVGSSQGLYALLGMGAVAASVLGAPLSTVLIVFELTGGYDMTIALLLTVSISVGLSQALLGHSYFHWQLAKRGLFLHDGPHRTIMRRLDVASFMTPLKEGEDNDLNSDERERPWLLPSDTLERALRQFDRTGESRIAVVAEGDTGRIIGWADRLAALSIFNKALIDANVEEHR